MTKIYSIYQNQENELTARNSDDFETVEEVVDAIVEKGLPENLDINTYSSKISKEYNLSERQARTCIRLAYKQSNLEKTEQKQENAQTSKGYYYQTGYYTKPLNSNTSKNDGMDSLSAYSNYNKLMFGIR